MGVVIGNYIWIADYTRFRTFQGIQIFSNCTCVEQAARDLGSKRARSWWRAPPPKEVPSPLAASQLSDTSSAVTSRPDVTSLPDVTSPPWLQSADVVDESPLRGAVEGFCPSDCDKVFYIVGKETGTYVFICTSTKMLTIFMVPIQKQLISDLNCFLQKR